MATKIQIWTRLHEGIYRSLGGGETRVVREWNYGPRNLVKAYRELQRIRRANERNYGNIGCGSSGLRTTDGRFLDSRLAYDDGVKTLESALLTPAQFDELNQE